MMKRLLTIYFAVIGFTGLHAQEAFAPINFSALEKKIQKSDLEIVDPKKGVEPKIWIKRGEIMLSVFDVDLEQTYEGMNPTNLVLFYPEPVITTEDFEGKSYEVYTYERIKFYFENKTLSMYVRTKTAFDDHFNEAFKCFGKAGELDQEGKFAEKLYTDFNKLKNQLKRNGINSYYRGSKEDALKSFEMVLVINKLPVLKGAIDTIMIQYSGIIARELNHTDKAIEHYLELASVSPQPNTYLQLKEDYLRLKDTTNAISLMEKAFQIFPDSTTIVANLVDLYIRTNRITDGIKTVEFAIAKSPDKGELYYWKGRLQLNSPDADRIDQALKAYDIAIKKSPELYYAYYDIGFIYFLQGQDLFTRAGDEKDKKFREELIAVGTENYQKALPMLEKALELNTVNKEIKKETLDTLKRLYYKLQMTDKYDEATEKLKNM